MRSGGGEWRVGQSRVIGHLSMIQHSAALISQKINSQRRYLQPSPLSPQFLESSVDDLTRSGAVSTSLALKCAVPAAIGAVRATNGQAPGQAVEFLLELLRSNDNHLNKCV